MKIFIVTKEGIFEDNRDISGPYYNQHPHIAGQYRKPKPKGRNKK